MEEPPFKPSEAVSETGVPPFATFIPFLSVVSFLTFLSILSRTIFAPMTPIICQEMSLCHAETGHLFLMLSIGFAITLFLSQYVSTKITHKATISISLYSTAVLFLLMPLIDTYNTFCSFLFVVGLSAGLFIPSSIAIIRSAVSDIHLGKAFGIRQTAQSCAFIFGPAVISIGAPYLPWRFILLAFGIFFLLFAVLFSVFFKAGKEKSPPVSFSFVKGLISMPSFWIMLVLLCLINGMNYGVYNMAPSYYDAKYNIDRNIVNTLIMVARILSFFTAVLSGFLADRIGIRRSLFMLLSICGVTTLFLGVSSAGVSLFLFMLQSALATALMSLIHLATASIVPANRSASSVSMMAPFAFTFGSGVVPKVIGLFADNGLYAVGFVCFGVVAIVAAFLFNSNWASRYVDYGQLES